MKKVLWITALLLLVAGSAVADDSREKAAKSFSPPAGQANLYVSRKSETLGMLLGFRVLVDGEQVAELKGGTFAFVPVSPGAHKIEIQAGTGFATLDFKAAAGKNYFYETGAKPKKALLEPEISLVILEPMGRLMISQAKLSRD